MTLSIEDIRTYTKDEALLNTLLEGDYQSSTPLIELGKRMAISDFNAVTPVTTFTEETFPNDLILMYGILHHLANSEAERQLRNNVNFSAQGLQAGIDDKQAQYSQMATYYKQLFDQKAKPLKQNINQEQAWGGNDSPYSRITDYQYRS